LRQLNYSPEENQNLLRRRVDELREGLGKKDPAKLADSTGTIYIPGERDEGLFQFQFWGQDTYLTFPALIATDRKSGRELSASSQALLIYYMHTADGFMGSGQWISFSELPDGRFYNQAFQGYTGKEIARKFKNDLLDFEKAAKEAGGSRYPHGDTAFIYKMLPRVSLIAVYWQGDEDFPSSAQILFGAEVSHYLPTDACAIAGSMLTRRLVSFSGES
jgi:hypothetical protein